MKFYAHTLKTREGENLFTFVDFPDQQFTAKEFVKRTGKRHKFADLAEIQIGWQPLSTHLVNVAEQSCDFAKALELGEEGFLAGLLHDLGKYRQKFQLMLRGLEEKAPHAYAGSSLCQNGGSAGFMAASFAIGGHHAGLANGRSVNKERIDRQESVAGPSEELLKTAIADFKEQLVQTGDSHETNRLQRGIELLLDVANQKPALRSQGKDPLACEFLTRLLFSALVDADRLDTERFTEQHKADTREGYRRQAPIVSRLRGMLDIFIGEKSAAEQSVEVRTLRESVRLACERDSQLPRGMFTLNVPTGGGKTLASMNFALRHAEKHGLRRVIVVEPYLSIIDQVAKEFREAFGRLAVLEHHSLSTASPKSTRDENPTALDLAAENWSAPIIVTTTVQFFESLFTDSPATSRKLHNLANSVVIFDEVQNFPRHLLLPLLAMLQQFSEFTGTSFVFMSATLPDFSATVQNAIRFGEYAAALPSNKPIQATLQQFPLLHRINDAERPFTITPRVHYDWEETLPGLSTWPQITDAIQNCSQSLTIVNLKRHAHALCSELLKRSVHVLHLSTNLCPAHRRKVLREAAELLKTDQKFALVATQCIEAGVDIDFPVLFRAVGPLDSIAQAAGRCNRHGIRPQKGRVILFTPEDEGREEKRKLPPSAIYQQGTTETRSSFWKQDLNNPETFVRYYDRLFRLDSLDHPTRPEFQDRKINRDLRPSLAFEDTARAFQVIDSPTTSVLVGWDSRGHSVQRLKRLITATRFRPGQLSRVMRMVRHFQVNIYEHEFRKYTMLFEEVIPGVYFTSAYHAEYGLNLNGHWPQDFVC
jgi:CRISPR-associated endonuclease/helicase Cas3